MTVIISPDPEAGAKVWLKGTLTTVSGRVFYAVPAGTPTLPLVTITELVTMVDKSAPVERVRLSHQCWGRNKAEAAAVRRELVSLLQSIQGVRLDDTTFCHYVTDVSSTWVPDDEAKLARYVVDATYVNRV